MHAGKRVPDFSKYKNVSIASGIKKVISRYVNIITGFKTLIR